MGTRPGKNKRISGKSSRQEIENHHFILARHLGDIPIIQIVHEKNVLKKIKDKNGYIISADRFF